jgi:hypothetical protein
MSDDANDRQAAALVEALGPKLIEAILPKISESVEGQIKGLKEKNAELLDKLAKSKAADPLLEAADRQQKERLNPGGTFDARKATDPIKLRKSDARDVQAYRAAKAEAARLGVGLQIVADE